VTPRVLVLGGVDPSGGAGITADARALALHGVDALPVATALTVQNRFGFARCDAVAEGAWTAALRAALEDGELHAVKVGLLCDPPQALAVAAALGDLARRVPVVVDPVLSATAGGYAAPIALAEVYRRALAPLAAVLTPNLPELAAVLAGEPASALLRAGCGAVLAKGGHGRGDLLIDTLITARGERTFAHPRLPVGPVHGTGCALASAIAAGLARGAAVAAACADAIGWLQECLRAMGPPDPGGRPRPLTLRAPR
jgi:hydroxymethylpyrimidine/phosphomethylpyrimidine kinase